MPCGLLPTSAPPPLLDGFGFAAGFRVVVAQSAFVADPSGAGVSVAVPAGFDLGHGVRVLPRSVRGVWR